MSQERKAHLALFGGIALKRGYCHFCRQMAIVQDGLLQCCDRPFEGRVETIKRVCEPSGSRRLSAKAKKRILQEQDYRCAYCWKAFGSVVHRDGKKITLRVNYDHQVPYATVRETKEYNILAACHVCNGLKSDYRFETVDECALFLIDKRGEKGYDY